MNKTQNITKHYHYCKTVNNSIFKALSVVSSKLIECTTDGGGCIFI